MVHHATSTNKMTYRQTGWIGTVLHWREVEPFGLANKIPSNVTCKDTVRRHCTEEKWNPLDCNCNLDILFRRNRSGNLRICRKFYR